MSDAPASPSEPRPPSVGGHHRPRRRRHDGDGNELPTPPPDPRGPGRRPDGGDVVEYLESILPGRGGASLFAPVAVTEEAFDHLDRLYKLMEQMLELREQNARLHRRIRDLEHFNKMEVIKREMEQSALADGQTLDLDSESAFAETLLESILADSAKKDPKQQSKVHAPMILRPSILRRNRSGSGADKQVTLDANSIVQQDDGCEKHEKGSKVSKWTKVKAAFRWEKASTTVSDNKSQDSGIHVPVNVEIAKYLRVPSTSDETGHSPADSGMAGISTPGSLSTTSSNEDFHRSENRTPYEDIRSSDDEYSQHYIPHQKDDHSLSRPHHHHHHHHKHPKTPWAKMKGIIPSTSSFKKKHRLSAASDEVQIDVEFCSDNDDNVFEDDVRNKTNPSSGSSSRKNSIPQDILERYRKALEDDEDNKASRWDRVKKAFLSKEAKSGGASPNKSSSCMEEEIQRDYKKLQKKLSLEFQEKMSEWERFKQNSPGASTPSPNPLSDENRDPNFIKKIEEWQKIKTQQQPPKSPLPNEFDLPPDFKKKLQEWEKIKKSSVATSRKRLGEVPKWKSLSGHRYEAPMAFEYPVISDEFRKKLEEWKQIKASGGADSKRLKEKTPSPKLSRKNSSPRHSKKQKDPEKGPHWFEKELSKIEKEKQRLERERQKFLEREERLSKLRGSIVAGTKKEVLIHTPSGFYRFEGISRKFTQKLYEWEKAQGIAPEASTFALLTSSYSPDSKPCNMRRSTSTSPPMLRSKSADSIAVSALNLTCPLMSHQPSSLSLNDMEELEKECLLDSKSSSMRYLLGSQEDLEAEDEPQAVLVEVEDYVEETAAPLHTMSEKQQLPVYQRQEFKTLCAGETIAAPKVRRSESTRAQTNYNLIEDIVGILRVLTENELEIRNIIQPHYPDPKRKLKEIYESQRQSSYKLIEKIVLLQEANSSVASSITKEENGAQTHLVEILEAVQDISQEVYQMTDKLYQNLNSRAAENLSTTNSHYVHVLENIRDIRSRIFELRRHLSYVCAASDTTVPNRKKSGHAKKTLVYKTISSESKSSRCDTSDNNSRRGSQKDEKHYIKGENSNNSTSSQGAVKKRIKYRQKSMLSKTIIDTDDDDEDDKSEDCKNVRPHKKLSRARTLSETERGERKSELGSDEVAVEECNKPSLDSPLTVFVKTTRKLFTPIGEANITIDKPSPNQIESPRIIIGTEDETTKSKEEPRSQLPPLPPSPVPQRKVFKEISPSIRLMLAKYNQRISEQDTKSNKSGNSSGSNSPIWRSPTSERRVRAQTERYQEELNKLSPLLDDRREVQKSKSASVCFIGSGKRQVTVPPRRDSVQEHMLGLRPGAQTKRPAALTLDLSRAGSEATSKHSPEIRQKKLQQAKEEFLKSMPTSATPKTENEELIFPARNRLSQISVDSDTSCDTALPGALTKSISAGMIHVDPDTYRQIDPELHGGGYVSLPRNSSQSGKKSALSGIAAKFRKVKMRKGKDKDKNKAMSTVSALCRHSLVVDINAGRNNDVSAKCPPTLADRSEATSSTSSSRSNSWIKKSLFKK